MEVLKGTAEGVRYYSETTGNEDQLSTHFIAVFNIGDMPVEIKLDEIIFIEEGDELVVTGKKNRGRFKANAYNNLSCNVAGCKQRVAPLFAGIVFLIVSILCGLWGDAVAFIFSPIGLLLIWHASQVHNAYRMVLSESSLSASVG